MTEAEQLLELIKAGTYNTDRPSKIVIKELIEVIKLLDSKIPS